MGVAAGFVAGNLLHIPFVGILVGLVVAFSICLGTRLWGRT
jgi:hypothetical protein